MCPITDGNVTLGKGVYITQTWVSGTSWYRVWSDGYIEQGGRVTTTKSSGTVTYTKAFSNTNYSLATVEGEKTTFETSGTDTGGYNENMGCTNGTTTGFRYSIVANRWFSWIAQGY